MHQREGVPSVDRLWGNLVERCSCSLWCRVLVSQRQPPPSSRRYLIAAQDVGSPVFEFGARKIETDAGARMAATMTPIAAIDIGESLLPELEATTDADQNVVAEAGRIDPQPAMWLVRGRGKDPAHHWRLDPRLGEDRSGVAQALLAAHLPTYRALYERGVALIVHLELEPDDVAAFRDAARALAHAGRDRHLLMVATQFTTMSLAKFEQSSFVRQFRVYARKATRMTGTFAAIQGD